MSGHHSFGHGGFVTSRRDFLQRCGMGLGALAVPTLSGQSISPLAPRQSQTEGKAKAVIHLFMNGGPSQVDTFDPKPELTKYHNKKLKINTLTNKYRLNNKNINNYCKNKNINIIFKI